MRKSKFNFIPAYQFTTGRKAPKDHVATVLKHWVLYLPKRYVDEKELEGKFLKFYIDTGNKALAWKAIEGETALEELGLARKVTKQGESGNVTVSIRQYMKSLFPEMNGFSGKVKIKIESYKGGYLDEPVDFISFKDEDGKQLVG